MTITVQPTASEIEFAVKNGKRLGFPGRLFLIDQEKDGNYCWRVSFNYRGARRELNVGTYPETSVDVAQYRASVIHAQVSAGLDPSEERRKAKKQKGDKFSTVPGSWLDIAHPESLSAVTKRWSEKVSKSVAESTHQADMSRLNKHLLPHLGDKRLKDIKRMDLLDACEKVVESGQFESAKRLIRACDRIFTFGKNRELVQDNPCGDVKKELPAPEKDHFAATTNPMEFAEILRKMYSYENGTPIVQAALKLAPILFVRPCNLRMAEWQEFDLENGFWLIPAEKMKTRKGRKKTQDRYVVPLPKQAVKILRELYALTGNSGCVFPGRGNNKFMSNGTLNKALNTLGISTESEQTGHGFRAVARTMLREQLRQKKDVIELQLDHVVKDKNGRAYDRSELIDERQVLMSTWANYLDDLRLGRILYHDPLKNFTPITNTKSAPAKAPAIITSNPIEPNDKSVSDMIVRALRDAMKNQSSQPQPLNIPTSSMRSLSIRVSANHASMLRAMCA